MEIIIFIENTYTDIHQISLSTYKICMMLIYLPGKLSHIHIFNKFKQCKIMTITDDQVLNVGLPNKIIII